MAPTMSSTGIVMDWGGGVCQVSTTLYNAALLSDFQVIERSAHYEPPAYVPLGLDATVADGQIDLKLKNSSSNPIYIKSSVEAGKMDVRIYGKREAQIEAVKIETSEKSLRGPQTLIVQDHSLPFGEEVVDSKGKPAFQVMVQRIKQRGNIELSRETISTDEFEGADRIVRVGTLKESGQIGK
jgi:vancomycin resistance protein YoaR